MDINVLKAVEVPAITVVCFAIAFALKKINENFSNFLPLICGLLGCGLGILGFYVVPDFPASDIFTALAVGTASGLAATGTNELIQQLREKFQKMSKTDKEDAE